MSAASNPDAKLLAVCTEFHANQHELDNIWGKDEAFSGDPRIDREAELADRYLNLRDEVTALAATTPEGVQAKASVILYEFRGEDDPKTYPGQYDPRSALALSLTRDVLRGIGA